MVFARVWRPSVAARSWQTAARRAASVFRPDCLPIVPADASQRARPGHEPVMIMHSAPVQTLPRRADFLRAASHGRKSARTGFVVQILKTTPDAPVRVGLTASRKVGNAVCRNRARRRLREIARTELHERALGGADIVLIARKSTATADFATLRADFRAVLDAAFSSAPASRT